MLDVENSVAVPSVVANELCDHLVRADGEEDLIFALWSPSIGSNRFTALLHTPIPPEPNDRQRHGNASFNQQYFERACRLAIKKGAGVAFMHSHPTPGWQDMSQDDVRAEKKMAGSVESLTNYPLLGMTVGSDRTWSARFWKYQDNKKFDRLWCNSVRVVGKRLEMDLNEEMARASMYREEFKRTRTVWGAKNHQTVTRLRIGIVGLGSVGSFVAELLSRMGFSKFVLIDFDRLKRHNLDRTLFASEHDIGRKKVDVVDKLIRKSSTSDLLEVVAVPASIVEEEGYRAALDCDVIFSCVDRPRARRILNHLAYAHLIPVIDGGISVRFKEGVFTGVDWQTQTVSPDRACLECLGTYRTADVATETEGMLDDPSYITGLPKTHRLRQNENVITFSANLASLEVMQLVALCTGVAGIDDFGVQRFRYNPGILDQDTERVCERTCQQMALIAHGDTQFELFGYCPSAEQSRRAG